MKEQEVVLQSKAKKRRYLRKLLKPKYMLIIAEIVACVVIGIGVKSHFFTEGQVTKLGFEDIGELVTQSANCTSVWVEDKDRKLRGLSIPFTQTKYIYTYDTVVKAGVDFSKVTVDDKDGATKEIYVDIPEVKFYQQK